MKRLYNCKKMQWRPKEMKGWQMYSRIQALKMKGFSIRQVSKVIRVSRNTIRKYWDMPPDEYAETYKTANRMTALSAYEQIVLGWLEEYPCMTAAQVRDWLAEKYQLDAAERTVRRYVTRLREKHGITRESEPKREYEAVEELPKGHQLQLDFGTKTVRVADSNRYIRLYVAVFTLSNSRYKWGVFLDRPFLSEDLVRALYGCFEYIGGMPRQLVYDQDAIIVVSENGGDIIHTHAFSAFLAETKLDVRVCRKADPESKGKIESSVKYVKGNFMAYRKYYGLEAWNQSFEAWLVRTGNKKEHGTTKRPPVEMFAEEQEHLLPLYGVASAQMPKEMDRNVRPDNTVLYRSNRYSVDYGTYSKVKEVYLAVDGGTLIIMDQTGAVLTTHEISLEKGKLIRHEHHRRNKGERIKAIRDKTVALLGEEFQEYLDILIEKKPRYVKEQFKIVVNACEEYGREATLSAMLYCRELELYSANDLRDAAKMISDQQPPAVQPSRLPVEGERYRISVQKRDLTVYTGIAAGSEVAS
jgi:transposase